MNFNAIFPGENLKAFINQDYMLEKRNATFAFYQMFRWVCIMQTRQCKFCKYFSVNSTNPAVQIVQTLQCKLYKHSSANCSNTAVQIVQTLQCKLYKHYSANCANTAYFEDESLGKVYEGERQDRSAFFLDRKSSHESPSASAQASAPNFLSIFSRLVHRLHAICSFSLFHHQCLTPEL